MIAAAKNNAVKNVVKSLVRNAVKSLAAAIMNILTKAMEAFTA